MYIDYNICFNLSAIESDERTNIDIESYSNISIRVKIESSRLVMLAGMVISCVSLFHHYRFLLAPVIYLTSSIYDEPQRSKQTFLIIIIYNNNHIE